MEQIEVLSWQTLDAVKNSAKIVEAIGDLESDENVSIFCTIDEDFLELFYSDLDANYIRRYDDEEEFYKAIEIRKDELGEERIESEDYYEDDFEEDEELEDFDIQSDDDL